jgi:hypothetical protein
VRCFEKWPYVKRRMIGPCRKLLRLMRGALYTVSRTIAVNKIGTTEIVLGCKPTYAMRLYSRLGGLSKGHRLKCQPLPSMVCYRRFLIKSINI